MKLSIIIVSWNVCEELIACLHSIRRHPPGVPYEVLVVDNHSADDTARRLRSEFPSVRLFVNPRNLGFAAANNIGIRQAAGEYLLLLNPDTIVFEKALGRLLDFVESGKEIGLCGPKLLNADHSLQRSVREFPTFRSILYRYTFLQYLGIFRRHHQRCMAAKFDYTQTQSVDQVMGAAMMIPRKVFDTIGLLDESFFMYYEEVDFCRRVREAGLRVVFCPQAEVMHLHGSSSGQVASWVQYVRIKSILVYFRKYRRPAPCFWFSAALKSGLAAKTLLAILQSGFLLVLYRLMGNRGRYARSRRQVKSMTSFLVRYYPSLLFQ